MTVWIQVNGHIDVSSTCTNSAASSPDLDTTKMREVLDLMLADTRILVVSKSGLLAAEFVHVLLTSMWPLTWIHTVILNWSEAYHMVFESPFPWIVCINYDLALFESNKTLMGLEEALSKFLLS
jgi:hypothetical protein